MPVPVERSRCAALRSPLRARAQRSEPCSSVQHRTPPSPLWDGKNPPPQHPSTQKGKGTALFPLLPLLYFIFFLVQRPAGPRAALDPQLWVPRGCRRGPLTSPLGDIPPALPQTLQNPEESFLKIALSSWPGPCPAFPGWGGGSSLCFCRGTDKSSGGIPPLLPSKPH